jgi:type I restriction enzyme R subunit
MSDYKTIAESNSFIVLDKYVKDWQVCESYQSEYDLEREFIQDLQHQGYDYAPELNTPEKLLANVRVQLQALPLNKNVQFTDGEWWRFVETWLDKPSDGIVRKPARFTTTISTTLSLTTGVSRTSICWTRRTSPATRCR